MAKANKFPLTFNRFAIVKSKYNPEVTNGLLRGALDVFEELGIHLTSKDVFEAPGAFEIPLIAQTLARTGRYDGVVCLGCVVKGDTAHFEFISLAASIGIQQASLATAVPITFGILTTYSDAQAAERAKRGPENKGREAAAACVASTRVLAGI
ncbi:MAG: 6,7-dimethyl-8-ribityllumazine synthase [Bdellovibrionota bacterium]